MNKVIFLDVDGVLNNGKWAEEMYRKPSLPLHTTFTAYNLAIGP